MDAGMSPPLHTFAQADATRLPLADQSVDLVFTSPPYVDARTYGIGAQRDCAAWAEWMLGVVRECCRVSRGLVLINCAGVTRDHCYQPGPEVLLARWWMAGGQCWRPAYWHRVGIPGSGGKQWLASRIEHVLAFKGAHGNLPWADSTANGHAPKYDRVGGALSFRTKEGLRINAAKSARMPNGHNADGTRKANRVRCMPSRANPGNLLRSTPAGPGAFVADDGAPVLVDVVVGGGKLGNPIAHENEAPFPEAFAAWFIRSWCPPGGTVLDPFSGSGTTVAVARQLGRQGIGFDLRMSQCELGRRRVATKDESQTDLFSSVASQN